MEAAPAAEQILHTHSIGQHLSYRQDQIGSVFTHQAEVIVTIAEAAPPTTGQPRNPLSAFLRCLPGKPALVSAHGLIPGNHHGEVSALLRFCEHKPVAGVQLVKRSEQQDSHRFHSIGKTGSSTNYFTKSTT